MLIDEGKGRVRTTHEMKFVLPADLCIRLHTAKIVERERISDVVVKAVEAYLRTAAHDAREQA